MKFSRLVCRGTLQDYGEWIGRLWIDDYAERVGHQFTDTLTLYFMGSRQSCAKCCF